MFFPPDEVRQIMHSESDDQWGSGESIARVKFGAHIENDGDPIEVKIVEERPREVIIVEPKPKPPPHWDHRSAVIAATIAVIAIVTMVILVLTLVTPYLHSPDH